MTEAVNIKPAKIVTVGFNIKGTAPLVQHKFSKKIRDEMKQKQETGQQSRSRKVREKKDFDKVFRDAIHFSEEGWIGVPSAAFRAAMIDACRLVGFKMTLAKQAIFIIHDGLDADEGTPLIKLECGEPERYESYVRASNGQPDVTVRPMWRRWNLQLIIKYDSDVFSQDDVANLLQRAGMQVGIGEGRPFSKNSAGQGWGTFEIA